jgi:hypothetical protein
MADFATERAAYLAGFGDGSALVESLRAATLVVPLDVEGNVFTWRLGGLPWMTAFTDVTRCARFADAAGRDQGEIEFLELYGHAVIEGLLEAAPTPTGLVIDAASSDVMAFPPVSDFTPHNYIDVDTGELVTK